MKSAILKVINNILFEEVSIPKSLANDNSESIVDIFTEFDLTFVIVLIKNFVKNYKVLHQQFLRQNILLDLEIPTKIY